MAWFLVEVGGYGEIIPVRFIVVESYVDKLPLWFSEEIPKANFAPTAEATRSRGGEQVLALTDWL